MERPFRFRTYPSRKRRTDIRDLSHRGNFICLLVAFGRCKLSLLLIHNLPLSSVKTTALAISRYAIMSGMEAVALLEHYLIIV